MTRLNTPVEFSGDIVIADPACIINPDNDDRRPRPSACDFFSRCKFIGSAAIEPDPRDYEDCHPINISRIEDPMRRRIASMELRYAQRLPVHSDTYEMEKSRYMEALDEYYSMPFDDWDRSNGCQEMEQFGFTNYLVSPPCDVGSVMIFNSDDDSELGTVYTDSSKLSVFYLEEILRYNPHFDTQLGRSNYVMLINDFRGAVKFMPTNLGDEGRSCELVGTGNVNFISTML